LRQTAWAAALSSWLVQRGVRPNQISFASVAFSVLAACCLLLGLGVPTVWRSVLLVLTAGCIQARLLCNLLDGMVAIEGGMKTKSGEIFNDLPDRVADALILVSAGYATGWSALGWAAALLAVLTAYVRLLGAATGAGHDFRGPMAKQQRMALMTAACLGAAVQSLAFGTQWLLVGALALIVVGCVITAIRRVRHIASTLEAS
jgi:phosphatidylglycerophosphate synthase